MNVPRVLRPLQKAKHLGSIWAREWDPRGEPYRARKLRREAARRPYVYDPEAYREHIGAVTVPASWTFPVNHLEHAGPFCDPGPLPPAPEVIWCFWTGSNAITENRLRSLEQLRAINHSTPLELITPDRMETILVPEAPLHPVFEHLSAVHKSDYLRSYVMLHHGGAYCDIKKMTRPWGPLIDELNDSPYAWAAGPEELSPRNTCPASGPLGEDQQRYFSRVLCQAAHAFKPGSPFASEWWAEINRRMDYFADLLRAHPATDPFGSESGYRVPWSALQGYVFGPLCLKFADRLIIDPDMTFDYSGGYR